MVVDQEEVESGIHMKISAEILAEIFIGTSRLELH